MSLNEILGFATDELLAAYPINAEDLTYPMVVKQALPETGANVERIVEVLRRNKEIGVHKVVLVRHQRSPMSNRLA